MILFSSLKFQKQTIEDLTDRFLALWKKDDKKLPLVFKSPTGSGKTFVMANFIRHLNHLPQWQEDKAFIWITFSDDLAMQSKDKFNEYFENQAENAFLTVNDINRGKLYENDIIFLNWQKIIAKSAESRVLRRPEDEIMHKEFGKYWEDVIDGTHGEEREIILIIDEAHKNKSTKLAQDVIDYINPKIIIHVTATPDEKDELEARRLESFIEVGRERVVDEGLIKEKIVVQTDEDLKKINNKDLDEVLLDLGMQKRDELKEELKKLKKDINPLMLIQLPNDDKKLIDTGEETKESVVTNYLRKKGIKDNQIAKWFDGKQENMELITENDSDVDFMLFKQAAGTGWDCPRASVLVMFREIKSNKFYVQTVGRILRMPEPERRKDYKGNELLNTGYLFTNYKRNEVEIPDENPKNKPFTKTTKIKNGIKNISLKSAYISRIDYKDIPKSQEFQESFINSMNKHFGITSNDIMGQAEKKIKKKGVDLSGKLTNKIIANAEFADYDQLSYEFNKEGIDVEIEMSVNDVEKTFNYICYQILQEQTDEKAKYTNIARSWSRLKSAIRVWFQKYLNEDCNYFYRVFINDINKGAKSEFRPAITKALIDFKPIADKILKNKRDREEEIQAPVFSVQNNYSYTDDYVEEKQKLCCLDKFYILKDYKGRKNELKFKDYIDDQEKKIDWWFKNGDYGQNYFAIKYMNTVENKNKLFYPDWIVRFKNGKIGIFDTKDGITAKDTEGRAEALSKKVKELGKDYVGGIVIYANGNWYYNDSAKYKYDINNIETDKNWKHFNDLLK